MLSYEFMRIAFLGGSIIAIICGIVSYFVIIRQSAFAAHGLAHISLTGAAGGVLIGISALSGQLIVNIIAAVIMGLLGDKIKKNDLAVGLVLTFFLGLGAYFLYLYQSGYSGSIMSILFGNILTISSTQITTLLILAIIIVATLALIARMLFFSALDPILADASGLPKRLISIVFFIVLALTVSMACQIAGVLLVFALLIGPAAIANQWTQGFYSTIVISIIVSTITVWLSLTAAFYLDLPASFCITMLICLFYLFGLVKNRLIKP
ncbi:MAG: metal ABC transporter permease [Francisellaceae bacterium]